MAGTTERHTAGCCTSATIPLITMREADVLVPTVTDRIDRFGTNAVPLTQTSCGRTEAVAGANNHCGEENALHDWCDLVLGGL